MSTIDFSYLMSDDDADWIDLTSPLSVISSSSVSTSVITWGVASTSSTSLASTNSTSAPCSVSGVDMRGDSIISTATLRKRTSLGGNNSTSVTYSASAVDTKGDTTISSAIATTSTPRKRRRSVLPPANVITTSCITSSVSVSSISPSVASKRKRVRNVESVTVTSSQSYQLSDADRVLDLMHTTPRIRSVPGLPSISSPAEQHAPMIWRVLQEIKILRRTVEDMAATQRQLREELADVRNVTSRLQRGFHCSLN